jgi:hypothetical protein
MMNTELTDPHAALLLLSQQITAGLYQRDLPTSAIYLYLTREMGVPAWDVIDPKLWAAPYARLQEWLRNSLTPEEMAVVMRRIEEGRTHARA